MNNPWKVIVTHNIHSSIYYKFFCATQDFNIKFGLSTATKRDKKDQIKTLTVRFTDIRSAKDSAKPYINKKLKDCTIKLKASENKPIVMEYAYSKSNLLYLVLMK